MSALARLDEGAAVQLVRANWGRFIVDCVLCPSALVVSWGDDELQGVVSWDASSRRHLVQCLDCGAHVVAQWPELDMVRGVVRLLSMRPDVTTRNWYPGETLVDLVAENGEHGSSNATSSRGRRAPRCCPSRTAPCGSTSCRPPTASPCPSWTD